MQDNRGSSLANLSTLHIKIVEVSGPKLNLS